MLNDTKRDCLTYAKRLGDYASMSVETLLDGYCAALDAGKYEMNYYLCAVILRFWYVIDKLYQKSPNIGLDREDFFTWLVEAINYACKYRAWQDPKKHITATACINQCINTIRLQHYYEYNLDKHKANYNTISLDTPIPGDEQESTLLSIMPDAKTEEQAYIDDGSQAAIGYIQSYLNKNKIIEAIILDNIAFTDAEKHKKRIVKTTNEVGEQVKYTEYSNEFWAHKLVQTLGSLPDNYKEYFLGKYKIGVNAFDAALAQIKAANNQKLYKYLRACLATCKKDFIA